MNTLKTFDYCGTGITFYKNDNVLVNATEMIKSFPDRKMNNFLRNESTESFVKLLESKTGKSVLTVNHGGSNPGTWMHQKLALKFAAWLSPEFELWVYDRIEELLTTGKTQLDPSTLSRIQILEMAIESERKVLILEDQNAIQNYELAKAAPKVKFYESVMQSETNHTITTIAKELGMSGQALNKLLKTKKIQFFQDGHWVLCAKYQGLGYTKTKTFPIQRIEGGEHVPGSSIQTVWTEKGRHFLHTLLNPMLNRALIQNPVENSKLFN